MFLYDILEDLYRGIDGFYNEQDTKSRIRNKSVRKSDKRKTDS